MLMLRRVFNNEGGGLAQRRPIRPGSSMFDPSKALAGFRIPFDLLVALDYRPLHFALQPYHFLIRAAHVMAMGVFFGGIVLLDLRLMSVRSVAPLRHFTEHLLPWLYITFAITFLTGVALFLYDPVHVGSHAYFTLKLLFMLIGLANAGLFHRWALSNALKARGALPPSAKLAGAISLACWVIVVLCASLNVEGSPKVLLSGG